MWKVSRRSRRRARWLGHRLHTDVNVAVASHLSVADGHAIAKEVRHHLAYLSFVMVHVDPREKPMRSSIASCNMHMMVWNLTRISRPPEREPEPNA
jgi:divalent metal cation (Fe/Co/Zn/Cd) transporter